MHRHTHSYIKPYLCFSDFPVAYLYAWKSELSSKHTKYTKLEIERKNKNHIKNICLYSLYSTSFDFLFLGYVYDSFTVFS